MLSGIANQVAAAVENTRLAVAREEAVWTATVLLQVAEAIADAIDAAVRACAGDAAQYDDLTLIVVKRK